MNPSTPTRWAIVQPTLGQMILTALTHSIAWAAGVSVLVFVIGFVWYLFHREENIANLFGFAGVVLVVSSIMLFGVFLIGASRPWSDRAFTVSGFLATFFGLAVLAVFFVRLADEVANWFHYTPILVAQANLRNQKVLDEVAQTKKANEERLATLKRERDEAVAKARTDESKKRLRELFDRGIADEKKNFAKDIEQKQTIAQRSLRPDTSTFGMLWFFLTNSASYDPQDAGIGPALWGSIWLGIITVLFAVPVGVGAALYLEEYRTEGRLASLIQVNINNLAGVPSVVYGILGGFLFVYFFKILQEAHPDIAPRNLLGGGLTLGLLTLPMVIVSAQEAIRAVPPSLRQAAYALGATKWQVMWSIVLPMARPGIMTGTILSLSRAIGEAAPLVLFGALLYVDQSPSLFSRFTALPMQIFGWADRPAVTDPMGGGEAIDMWKYNAAVASTVLLLVLLSMNAVAIVLRNRAQKKMRY